MRKDFALESHRPRVSSVCREEEGLARAIMFREHQVQVCCRLSPHLHSLTLAINRSLQEFVTQLPGQL